MSFRQTLKSKRYNCEDCGKSFVEKSLDIKRELADGGRVENEFIQKCQRCFKTSLKKYRKQGWLQQQVMSGMLSVVEMAEYLDAKLNKCFVCGEYFTVLDTRKGEYMSMKNCPKHQGQKTLF